jgi:hypothetical protein
MVEWVGHQRHTTRSPTSNQRLFEFPSDRSECMKWLRYQRVISLEPQVGITSQRNKWANTDPGYTGGGIKSLGGVSIPCQPVTPAGSPVQYDHECEVIRCQCAKYDLIVGMENVRQYMVQ